MNLKRPSALSMARKSKSNFFLSFLFLGKKQRDAISAVYAFLHVVDDAVDLGGERGAEGLAMWRKELDLCYEGNPSSSIGQNLAAAIQGFTLPKETFLKVLEGIAMDLKPARYKSFEDLAAYCDRVAGAVGLLCVRIFGRDDESGRDYALNLGRALQLTNILRDVGEDAKAGKIYLPAEDMARFHVAERDLLSGMATPGLMDLLHVEASRARSFFQQAERLARESGPRSLLAGEIMRVTYQTLLNRVEKAGLEVMDRKVRLSLAVRAFATLRALIHSLPLLGGG